MFPQTVRFALFISFSLWLSSSTTVLAGQITLLEAIDLTLEYNDDLASKKAIYEADKELITQAKANVRPAIDYRYTIGKGQYSTDFYDDLDDGFNRSTLSLVQPVFSMQRYINLDRSKNRVEASQYRYEVDKQSKLLELVEAYITLLKHEEAAVIAEQEVVDHLVKMDRLDLMLDRGFATKMDILEARSVYDELNSDLLVVKNDALISKTRLSRLLGTAVDKVAPLDNQLWRRSDTILQNNKWQDFALENALAIDLSKKEYDVAKYDVRIEKAAHLPEVNFRAEVARIDSYDTSLTNDRKIQFELTLPIYHGGMMASKTRAAENQLKGKRYKLQDSERLVKVQLDEVLTKLEGGVAKIKAYEQSVESSNAYLQAAERGMTFGLRGLFDVLEAKSRLYGAQRKLIFEVYDNVLYQFEFLYLMGYLDKSTVADYLNASFSFSNLSAVPSS